MVQGSVEVCYRMPVRAFRREFDRRVWATRYLALLETVAVAATSAHRVAVDGDDAVIM